jgi:hypothetical protein
MPTLSQRALNRATLDRQLLLSRADRGPAEVVEHLVGLQAQAPLAPYVALWSRLTEFRPETLAELVTRGDVIRTTLMRATIHLVTARDAGPLRTLLQPTLERRFASSSFARHLVGVDHAELLALGRELLATGPLSRVELGARLAERWPDRDQASLAYAITFQLPLIQLPPRGVWGELGPIRYAMARPVQSTPDTPIGPEAVVIRYLGAFGPASVKDIQTWSGLTRLREVVERLRPRLYPVRDEPGTELFDLPDAPRPDPDTLAPPRFLPEYDNLLLSHADRARVIPDRRPVPLYPGNGATFGTVLVDGCYRADWRLDTDLKTAGTKKTDTKKRSTTKKDTPKEIATLRVQPFARLSRVDRAAVEREAYQLLDLLAAGAETRTVQIEPAP